MRAWTGWQVALGSIGALGPPFDRLRAGSPGTPGCGSTRPSEDCGPAHHER